MKVLDLRCAHGHGFEGWFASDDEFQDQRERAVLECPLCSDRMITRLPSAPRLNLSGAREPAAPATAAKDETAMLPREVQAMWLRMLHQVIRNTEDVGERFAEEARRIHYGESEHRGIRGKASAEERAALADEGIEVMPLPIPASLEGPLQ